MVITHSVLIHNGHLYILSRLSFVKPDQIRDSCELLTRMGLDFRHIEVQTPSQSSDGISQSSQISLNEPSHEMEVEFFTFEDEVMEEIEEPPIKRVKPDIVDPNGDDEEEIPSLSIHAEDVEVRLRENKRCNICPHCSARIESKNFKRHMEELHSGDSKFSCILCQKCYKRKEDLDKHLCPE